MNPECFSAKSFYSSTLRFYLESLRDNEAVRIKYA